MGFITFEPVSIPAWFHMMFFWLFAVATLRLMMALSRYFERSK